MSAYLSRTIEQLEPQAFHILSKSQRLQIASILRDSGILKEFLPRLLLPHVNHGGDTRVVTANEVRTALQTGDFEGTCVALRHHQLVDATSLGVAMAEQAHMCTHIYRTNVVAVRVSDESDEGTPSSTLSKPALPASLPFLELTMPKLSPVLKLSLYCDGGCDAGVQVAAFNGTCTSKRIILKASATLRTALFTPCVAQQVCRVDDETMEAVEPPGEVPAFLVSGIMHLLHSTGIHHLATAKSGVYTYLHAEKATLRHIPRDAYNPVARTEMVIKMHPASCNNWCLENTWNQPDDPGKTRAEIVIAACGCHCPPYTHKSGNISRHQNCVHGSDALLEGDFCLRSFGVKLRTWRTTYPLEEKPKHEVVDQPVYLSQLAVEVVSQLKHLFAGACRWCHFDLNLTSGQRLQRRVRLLKACAFRCNHSPFSERDVQFIDILRRRRAGVRGVQPPRLEWLNGKAFDPKNADDAAIEAQLGWMLWRIQLPVKPVKPAKSSLKRSRSGPSSTVSTERASADATHKCGNEENRGELNEQGVLDSNTMDEYLDVDGMTEVRRQIHQLLDSVDLPASQRERGDFFLRVVDQFDAQSERKVVNYGGIRVRGLRNVYTQRADGGRLYPQSRGADMWDPKKGETRTIALQAAPRELRPFLCGRFCHDLDMRVAHPQIIRQMVWRLTWPDGRPTPSTAELTRWCHHRDEYIEHIAETHSLPPDEVKWPEYRKDCAKLAVLLSTFGGSYETWMQKVLVDGLGRSPDFLQHEPRSKWVQDLQTQLLAIREAVFESTQWREWSSRDMERLRQIGKKRDLEERKRSTFSRIIQKEEDRCLTAMRRFLAKHEHRVMSLQFDGLIVAGGQNVDYDLAGMEQAITAETGYEIQLMEKELWFADTWPTLRLDIDRP